MSFSYTDPSMIRRDAVRLLIGDTVAKSALFQDAEIEYFLTKTSDEPAQAAIMALDVLATRFANQVDISLGKLSISNAERSRAYADRAATMRKKFGVSAVRMITGGGSSCANSYDACLNPLLWNRWC